MTSTLPRLALAAATALGLAAPATALAQARDDWQFNAAIYAYLPEIGGKTVFPPPAGGSSVSLDAETIVENLKFTFMGTLEARRGRWGVYTDVVYMDIGDTRSQFRELSLGGRPLPAGVNANASYDLKGWSWTLAGEYVLSSDREANVALLAGARLLDIEQTVGWEFTGEVGSIAVGERSGRRVAELTNWDAVVGVKGRLELGSGGKWFVPFYVDVGTGDSDLTWQAYGGLGYAFSWGNVVAVWRYLDYEMKSGSKVETLNFNGPAIAAVFRW